MYTYINKYIYIHIYIYLEDYFLIILLYNYGNKKRNIQWLNKNL